MPELPDISIYVEHIAQRIVAQELETIRLRSPFLLRTVDPPLKSLFGKKALLVERLGKRIVIGFEEDLFVVLHLMIAGRLRFRPKGAPIPGKLGLASFDFATGSLLLTEASTRKRASLHVVRGRPALEPFNRGGLEVLTADLDAFRQALARENHTIKRSLTDPRLFSGIGNSYSDEILHAAKLSPVKRTAQLSDQRSNSCSRPRAKCCSSGQRAFARRPVPPFRRRSLRFAKGWRCTGATENRAPTAALPFSASSTQTTKPTTAPAARPAASC